MTFGSSNSSESSQPPPSSAVVSNPLALLSPVRSSTPTATPTTTGVEHPVSAKFDDVNPLQIQANKQQQQRHQQQQASTKAMTKSADEEKGLVAAAPKKRAPVPASFARFPRVWYCFRSVLVGPKGTLWWESVVILRKLLVVLLATLVDSPLVQLVGFAALFSVALLIHVIVEPYALQRLNRLEAVSLGCLLTTALVSTLVLDRAASLKVVDDGSLGTVIVVTTPLPTLFITVILVAVNFLALIALGITLVRAATVETIAPKAQAAIRAVRRRASRRGTAETPIKATAAAAITAVAASKVVHAFSTDS